ncbi:MAG: hypothetical protein M4579_004738 [Chaenotheca gracillima]|nr:MAG: hypothetical protein M4579_004738 [Chaenotheca gracillima]
MATSVKDSFSDLDRHRERLEENIAKLRQALRHWQTWEAEYEGLKEDVSALGENASTQEIIAVGSEYEDTVLDEKEIKSLLGQDSKSRRKPRQISDVISRRIEYVQRNVQTIEKQLQSAENKLASVLVIQQPEAKDEAGLPLLEIREELDDNGKVISSSTSLAKDEAPRLLDALEKAGIKEEAKGAGTPDPRSNQSPLKEAIDGAGRISEIEDPEDEASTAKPIQSRSDAKQSRVSSDETQEVPNPQFLKVLQSGDEATNSDTTNDTSQGDLDKSSAKPVIPTDESPEDAALRQEMLDYSFSEVRSIVAELELEENASQFSEDEEDYTDDAEVQTPSSAEDENEDRFGRTTRKVVTDDYRKEMEALEEKLNARMLQNVGPKPTSLEDEPVTSSPEKRGAVKAGDQGRDSRAAKKRPSGVKGVRFADELDISPAPKRNDASVSEGNERGESKSPPPPPLRESIIERSAPSAQGSLSPSSSSATPGAQKQSRFKAMRAATTAPSDLSPSSPHAALESPLPLPPTTTPNILSSTIVERPSNSSLDPKSPSPAHTTATDVDPILHASEVRSEYYARRNHLVHTQRGGFVNAEVEDEEDALRESGGWVDREWQDRGHSQGRKGGEDGKKMSLFRKARLG